MATRSANEGNDEVEHANLLVIGASVGRTGTTTLKTALEILYGMPCYEMGEVIDRHNEHVQLWSQLYQMMEANMDAELPEDVIRRIFHGYQLTVSNPGCVIYKQLLRMYPEAKVIVTTRNPQTWIQSMRETVMPKKPLFATTMLGRLRERCFGAPGFGHMADQSVRLALGGNVDLADDEQMIHGFLQRVEEVKRAVPSDRLLVFEVKDGWEPLCRFLNKPIPDVPFPHVNDRKQMQERIRRMRMQANAIVCGAVSVCLIAIVCSVLLLSPGTS